MDRSIQVLRGLQGMYSFCFQRLLQSSTEPESRLHLELNAGEHLHVRSAAMNSPSKNIAEKGLEWQRWASASVASACLLFRQ